MIDVIDRKLLVAVSNGLPVISKPYEQLAQQLGIEEAEVLTRLNNLREKGVIKRFGVIVKHRQLGYLANAMVVFDIPNERVDSLGQQISQFEFVNLCYLRPRYPDWPYNLYCMIHGKSRELVLQQLARLISECKLAHVNKQVLFSRRCFKQRGAVYHMQP